MFDFSVAIDNIKDLYREKKVLFIVISILIVLFFLGLIAFLVQSLTPAEEVVPVALERPLEPDQRVLLPEGPSIPDGYAVTREPQEKWSMEEGKEFFTLPDATELKALESANNKLVDDILGAAP